MNVEYTTKVEKRPNGMLYAAPPHGDAALLRDIVLQEAAEKHGGHVTIRISTPRRPRSKAQQGLLHDWLQDIAKETGNDLNHVKMAMKIMAMSEGWPAAKKPDGSPIIDLVTGNPMPISEAGATVEQEKILMNVVQRFAAEYQIRLKKEAALFL